MSRLLLAVLSFAALAFMAQWGWGGIPETKESHFTISSHGFRIGSLTSTYAVSGDDGPGVVRYSSATSIKAHFLVRSYALENREEALVSPEGTLRYSRISTENGRATRVEGTRRGDAFVVTVSGDSGTRTLIFPRTQYSHTTMECPELQLKKEGDRMTMRLLDLETLEIVTRHYTWVRTEEVVVGARRFACRVVAVEDKNKKFRRWERPDDVGIMIARQEGEGKNGSYTVRLVDYAVR